jgi:hypothetical protein
MNQINKKDFYAGLLDALFYSKVFDLKIKLIGFYGTPDPQLIDNMYTTIPTWVYHYMVPAQQTYKYVNIVLLATQDTLSTHLASQLVTPPLAYLIDNYVEVLKTLNLEIDFKKFNINEQLCKFSSQLF